MKIAFTTALLLAISAGAFAQTTQPAEKERKQYNAPPPMTIDTSKKYSATIDTDKGPIEIELFAKQAPKTVNNFVFLAKQGFYDDTIFHRVIPGFMIQGGDPTGTGRGGPGYEIENENKDSQHGFPAGTLAMANHGPDTNGSQFFINDGDSPWLTPQGYTIFGQVTKGQDVVHAIATAARNEQDRPNEPIHIKGITIHER
jgi:cyclophilin family peptidyl-prolyl cis-trans isomerase